MRKYLFFIPLLFVTGGVIMLFELLASRILAPAIGTTITVWTAIIGVILAAISWGYYKGGVMADRKKDLSLPAGFLFGAALWTWLIIAIRSPLVGASLTPFYSVRALLLSVIFFGFPAFSLGFVNTYCIRVAEGGSVALGKINGVLYGASTLGSAAGILLASFYFIPHYPVTIILRGVGATLLLLSGILFIASRVGMLRFTPTPTEL